MTPKVRTCIWYVDRLDAALTRYAQIFGNDFHVSHRDTVEGSPSPVPAVVAEFELFGQPYVGLQGGPAVKSNESFSFYLLCEDQAEVDRWWTALLEGGGKEVQCGWLTDPFGISWQIVPKQLHENLWSRDRARRQRVIDAMMTMVKIDVAKLEAAAKG
jgi:predicted 3-demethylubiquinone-9 3-methyltransferase (glyoxalase superfamily)